MRHARTFTCKEEEYRKVTISLEYFLNYKRNNISQISQLTQGVKDIGTMFMAGAAFVFV